MTRWTQADVDALERRRAQEPGTRQATQRVRRSRRREEDALQEAVHTWNEYNRSRLAAIPLHIPNEGKRSPAEGARQVRAGLLAGAPDWLYIGERCVCIELKTADGRLSPEQREFRDRCEALGIAYHIARSVPEVEQILLEHGLLTHPGRAAT